MQSSNKYYIKLPDENKHQKQEKTLFVQPCGCLYCRNAGLKRKIAEGKRHHSCKCRDPKCSFQCKRNCAVQEQWTLEWRLKQIPAEMTLIRGCLGLPENATHEDHAKANKNLKRELDALRKEGVLVELIQYPHDTDPHNRHYDYVGFTDRFDLVVPLMHRHNKKKNAPKKRRNISSHFQASCVPFPRSEIPRWTKYVTKLNMYHGKENKFYYLAARDGSRTKIPTNKFWGCTKAERQKAWIEFAKRFAEKHKEEHKMTGKENVKHQLLWKILPECEEEAATIWKIMWAVRPTNGIDDLYDTVRKLLWELPVKKKEGLVTPRIYERDIGEQYQYEAFYLPSDNPRPWIQKMFGDGPYPYHEEFNPLPPEVDDLIHPVNPEDYQIKMKAS